MFSFFNTLRLVSFFAMVGGCLMQQVIAQTLSLGDYITLKDKQTNVYYASVRTDEADPLHFSLLISLKANNAQDVLLSPTQKAITDSITVDGCRYANGDRVRVVANVSKHKLEYADQGQQKEIFFVLTSLPIVTIDRQSSGTFDLDAPVLTRFSIYDPFCRTEQTNLFSSFANITLRGATASKMDKKSYKAKLIDKDTNEKIDASIFGIRSDDTWILDAAAIDYSRIRNRVCTDVWNSMSTLRDDDMMRNGTQGQFCELMLDGEYQGIYCITDNISRKLLGLKKIATDADTEVRGILYKCTGNDYGTSKLKKEDRLWEHPNTDTWYDWELKYPDDIYDERSWQPLYDLIDHTDQLSDSPDSVRMLTDCFYYDNMVEYAVFCMSMQLLDNVMHNTFLSVKNRSKSFKMWITPWDMDGSLGRDGAAHIYDAQANSFQVFGDAHPFRYYYDNQVQPFYNDFTRLMKQLHSAGGPLSVMAVSQVIDHYTEQLEQSGSWKRERERWDGMNNFWFDTPIILTESLAEETGFMKNWYKLNDNYLDALCDVETVSNAHNTSTQKLPSVYMINGISVNARINSLPSGVYIVNGKKIVK